MSQAGPSSPPQEENRYAHSPETNRSSPPSMQVSETAVDASNFVTKDELQAHFKNFETLFTQFQANIVATMPLQAAQGSHHFPASNPSLLTQQAAQGIQSVSVSNQPVAPQFLDLAPPPPPRFFDLQFCFALSKLEYCSTSVFRFSSRCSLSL